MAEALNTFLANETLGSPIEAAELGAPVNGPDDIGAPGAHPQVGGPVVDVYPGDLDQQHRRLVQWFEDAERATDEARKLSERDRDYHDGYQLDADTLKALKARGQPPLVDNFVRDKIQLLLGLERKARTDPKAYPRTPSEEQRAEAATQALRYISDDNDMPLVRSNVFENMLVEGTGGAEIGLEDDGKGGVNITMTHIGWERIWFDPHSRAKDFSDARYLGVVIWADRDVLEDTFPGAVDVIESSFKHRTDDTYGDRPGGQISWRDPAIDRCRVVQAHWKEGGTWWRASFTQAGFLSEPEQSRFKDRKGRSACPLILQSAFIDRENRRFGAVRDMISGQDAINKRQSKALHLLSVNRIIADQGAVADVDKARREAAKPDGYIEKTPGMDFEIASGGELASGQFQLLQIAMQRMQAKGPNAAMSGTDPRDQSGRAILAQQAGGAAANEPLADGLRQWTRRAYELAWMAAREFWKGERWIRVTDDLGKLEFVGLNRPVRLMDRLAEMPPEQRAMAMQQMGLQPNDPRLGQVIEVENDITDLEVDISIEEGMDVPAQQAEQFQALTQLAASLGPGVIPPEVIIAASMLPNKAELLDRLKQQQEAQAQQAQTQAPLIQAKAEAEVRDVNAKAAANEALAVERHHGAVAKVAQVHKIAAESPAIPVGGLGIVPQNELAPAGGMQ